MITDLTGTGVVFICSNQDNVISISDTVKDYSHQLVQCNDSGKILEGAQF